MLLKPGKIPTLVISSLETTMEVLKTQDLNFCSRPRTPGPKKLSYNFSDVAFWPYNENWRFMRKLLVSELFSVKRVQLFSHARDVEINRLINSLSQASPDYGVKLDDTIFSLVEGIVCGVAFGKSYGGKQSKEQRFQEVTGETMKMMDCFPAEDFFPRFGWVVDELTGLRGRLEKCFRNLDDYFEMVLEEHLDHPGKPKWDQEDFVDVSVGLLKDQACAFPLTKVHIKALLVVKLTSFLTLS